MANISRPFQVALAGVVVLAAVWLFALRGHSTSTESSSSAPAASAPTASASSTAAPTPSAAEEEKAAAAKTPIYHGSAPGVQGLSSAIAKAHGAVAASQANAAQLEQKSAAASSSTGSAPTSRATSTPAASAPAASSAAKAPAKARTTPHTAKAQTKAAHSSKPTHHPSSSSSSSATRQVAVEHAIARGNVAVILFWDSKGADDRADASAVRALRHSVRRVSVSFATAGEVAAFGTITRGVQVYGTPTVLVVGKSGKATVLTGLTDRFALAQAVEEARAAS